MYVCICNSLTSKKIDHALNMGISDSNKIYTYFNCKPKCGKCLEFMNELIKEKKQDQSNSKYEKQKFAANY